MVKDKKMSVIPEWDLSDLYESMNSKEITKDIEFCKDECKKFEKKYKTKVKNLNGQDLYKAIKKSEFVEEKMGRIASFSFLNYAVKSTDSKVASFHQMTMENVTNASSHLVFFSLEVNKLSDNHLNNLYKESDDLKWYKPYLDSIRRFKKHQLSEDIEKLFLEKSITGSRAWIRLYDETLAGLKFIYKDEELNLAQALELLSSKDENIRKEIAKVIGVTFKENVKIFSYITNVLAKDKDISDNWHKFDKPISSRNLGNHIEDDVVDSLVATVKKNYSKISHRYYKLKADMMGKKYLNYYDRNAPLPFENDKVYSWNEAVELVLKGYNKFSPELAKLGKKFFDNNWIDVPPRKGKRQGAFASPCTPSTHPYLMLNFQGKIRDIMTLAHELGHGVHMLLSNDKGYFMSDTPLTLAETASVFGEQLIFREILNNENNPEVRKGIIANKVGDMVNTVVRQIAFLEFERRVHDERKKGEISEERICNIWLEVQKESLGEHIKFEEEYKYYWTYISHFIHSPFYVYSYAFGDCLVNSLYTNYLNDKSGEFESKYLEMLKAGGTLHHKELLKPFGLDASNASFWQNGIDMIVGLIDELEELNKK